MASMKILVLGGTAWLSRHIAHRAQEVGHQVLCAARGVSGKPPEGVDFVQWDRDQVAPDEIVSAGWDVVVDVSGSPGQVRKAVAAFPEAHWIFISTISVYAQHSQGRGRPSTTPLLPAEPHASEPKTGEMYGAMKVACEEIVRQGAPRSTILRPGLIVGPGDPTGRFTYWPARIAEAAQDGHPVIVPEPVGTPLQWIDVRDLAEWAVRLADSGTTGILDAVGPCVARQDFFAQLARPYSAEPSPLWVAPEVLAKANVQPWAGARSIPFWVPWAGWEHLMNRDPEPALEAGLNIRPLAETARDTYHWAKTTGAAATGLTRAEELEVIETLGSHSR